MDTFHSILIGVTSALAVELLGPFVRYLLYKAWKPVAAQAKKGQPSAVCSACGETTSWYDHPPAGGIRCSKCSYWEPK